MHSRLRIAALVMLCTLALMSGCTTRGLQRDEPLAASEQNYGYLLVTASTGYAAGSSTVLGMELPPPGLELQYMPVGGLAWTEVLKVDPKRGLLLQKIPPGEYELRVLSLTESFRKPVGTFHIDPGTITGVGHFVGIVEYDHSGFITVTRITIDMHDAIESEAALRAQFPLIAQSYPLSNQSRKGILRLKCAPHCDEPSVSDASAVPPFLVRHPFTPTPPADPVFAPNSSHEPS